MTSGAFGSTDYNRRTKKQLARRMLERELGVGDLYDRKRNRDIITQVCESAL